MAYLPTDGTERSGQSQRWEDLNVLEEQEMSSYWLPALSSTGTDTNSTQKTVRSSSHSSGICKASAASRWPLALPSRSSSQGAPRSRAAAASPPAPSAPSAPPVGHKGPLYTDGGEAEGSLPSVGSAGHFTGDCKPCAYWFKGVCSHAKECRNCHFLHEGQKPKRLRPSKQARKRLRNRQQRDQMQDGEGAEGQGTTGASDSARDCTTTASPTALARSHMMSL